MPGPKAPGLGEFECTLEELGVNLVKILANQNLARQSWLFI